MSFFCDRFEEHLLRKELADSSVNILVGATCPRGIGMCEEVCIKLLGGPPMLCKLLAVVGGQRMS